MRIFIEVFVQTVLAFAAILFITRLLGRQQIAQLTFYEYINGITFGSIAANLATDVNQKTYQHLTGLFLFGALTVLTSYIAMRNRSFRKVIEGEPILVIKDGKLLENNLKIARYSVDDLNTLLRQKDCFSPDEIAYGIIEINGNVSIIKTDEKKSVTLGDLNIKPSKESLTTEIILGGQVIYENLRKRKLDGKALMKLLKAQNVKSIQEVMFATIDEQGKLYVDKYEDNISSNIDLSENNENTKKK